MRLIHLRLKLQELKVGAGPPPTATRAELEAGGVMGPQPSSDPRAHLAATDIGDRRSPLSVALLFPGKSRTASTNLGLLSASRNKAGRAVSAPQYCSCTLGPSVTLEQHLGTEVVCNLSGPGLTRHPVLL